MMQRSTIAIAMLLLLPHAAAAAQVDYTLPTDGWYQVQDGTTYEEVCNSAYAPPCVLESGVEYKLINHSLPASDPGHRALLTLPEDDSADEVADNDGGETSARFERVGNRCPIGRGDPFSGRPVSCDAQCPLGTELIGVIGCSLDYTVATFDDELPTSFRSNRNTAQCFISYETLRDFSSPEFSAALNVEIVCAR